MSAKLTNCLRHLRHVHSITQAQLAAKVGVTRQTIIAIEKGNYTPSVLLALKLGMALNLKVEKIFEIQD